ncbi:MAG: hypothetical protein JRJ29_20240, partial [Deltaproteobacteria bacterium]|nr:hypothetical protein [Deltaproteobacteria bacterium]
ITGLVGTGKGALVFSGPLSLYGSISALRKAQKWDITGSVKCVTGNNDFSYASKRIRLHGKPKGLILVRGNFSRPSIQIRLSGVEGDLDKEYTLKDIRLISEGRYDSIGRNGTIDRLELGLNLLKANRGSRDTGIPLMFELGERMQVDIAKKEIKAPSFLIQGEKVLQLRGELGLSLGPPTRAAVKISDSHIFPRSLLPYLGASLKTKFGALDFDGPIRISGRVSGLGTKEKGTLNADLTAILKNNRFSFSQEEYHLKGFLSGHVNLKGLYPKVEISGDIVAGNTLASIGKKIRTSPFKASFSLSGNPYQLILEDFNAHIPFLNVLRDGREEKLLDTVLKVRRGQWDSRGRSFTLDGISISSPLLGKVTGRIRAEPNQMHLTLETKGLHLFRSARKMLLLPKDWMFSSSDVLKAEAVVARDGWIRFHSMLKVKELDFQNGDGAIMGEGLGLEIQASGQVDLRTYRGTATVRAAILSGELLYDRFYVDLGKYPLSLSYEGTFNPDDRAMSIKSLRLALKDVISLSLGGIFSNQGGRIHARISMDIPPTPLKPLFLMFLSEPFKAEKPLLGKLNVSGSFSSKLKLLARGKDWSLLGRLLLHNGELSTEQGHFSLKGINLDLPLWLEHGLSKTPRMDQGPGFLTIDTMILPALKPQPVSLPLVAGPNRLRSESPVGLSLVGGRIELGPFQLEDLFSGKKTALSTSLDVNSLDIQPILSKLKMPTTHGTVQGTLDLIRMERSRISTRGEITAEAYGGQIIFSGITVSDPFAPGPLFKLNIRINDLLLEDLTRGTSFGEIQGVLRGYVKDLEIAFGQPQRFDLMLETVKKKRIPQKISIRAVDNIARIGGGQSPFMGLAGMLASFFKNFNYSRIGIRAILENDVFKVNGTIREGGEEYLVKRSGISGVNVVNRNPDNRISFKDMVKRIKRAISPESRAVIR